MVNIGTLLAFVIVCAGMLVMREKRPGRSGPFRTPWVPFVPILGIGFSLLLMVTLPDNWTRLIIWLIIGMVIYFFYGRHHSKVQMARQRNPSRNPDRMAD